MNAMVDRVTIILTIVVLMISIFRRSVWYKRWAEHFIENGISLRNTSGGLFQRDDGIKLESPGFKMTRAKVIPNFMNREDAIAFNELRQTLFQLKSYRDACIRNNNIKLSRFKELNEEQRVQLIDIGYIKKIQEIESSINQDSKVVNDIIKTTLYQLYKDNKSSEYMRLVIELGQSLGYDINSNGEIIPLKEKSQGMTGQDVPLMRIQESLSHICRDWSPEFQNELDPITRYIESQLLSIPNINSERTLLVIPGCGVGYIPYHISKRFPNVLVESIEWSNLMYICNQFVLNHREDIELSPFSQYYSNQIDWKEQTRSIKVPLKDINTDNMKLKPLLGDFRNYIPNRTRSLIDNIVVISVYFLDTAKNVFEYLEAIESLSKYCGEELHWINVGPLKYGTRPMVQFTVEELRKLKQIRGWKDVDSEVINKQPNLNGYVTNTNSLYQGYYGLYKFHSKYNK